MCRGKRTRIKSLHSFISCPNFWEETAASDDHFWHQTHCSLQTVCGLWPYKTLLQYWKTPEPPSTILDEFTYLEPSALKEPALLCRTNLRILFKFGITSLLFRRKSTWMMTLTLYRTYVWNRSSVEYWMSISFSLDLFCVFLDQCGT